MTPREPMVLSGPDVERGTLSAAFMAFTASTDRLRNAYEHLKERVDTLNKELEQTNKYLESLLESMTSGVAAIGADGTITTFNKTAEEITGLQAASVVGRHYDSVFNNGNRFFHLTQFMSGRRRQAAGEADLVRKDGSRVPVEYNCSIVLDKNGNTLGAVQVFRDLTVLRRLEEQARRSERLAALGEMAAGVAHEIRNPLGGIAGIAGLLEKDLPDGDPRKRLASSIVEGARSLNHVVSSLLNYTSPLRPARRRFKLQDILAPILSLLQAEISAKDIELRVPPGLPDQEVDADPDLLKQVLLNLMSNAIEAMAGGGALSLSCRKADRGRFLEVTVRDTGPGIPPEHLDKVFNPFFTTKESGIGMGLAMAHKIIEAHGGRISVSSRIGEGAAFSVCLPSAQESTIPCP